MAKVILENTANGFFTINGEPYQKSEVQFFPSWEGSDRMNIQQYHGELLWGLLHFSEVALADGTTFGSVAEIIEWADSNAFGGGGGGSKVFDTSGDFPNPGKEGILYIDKGDDSMWYWDGTQYVQFASVKQFANFSGFPATGNPGYLYIDRAGLASYYWNGTAYIQLSGPGTFIRNQNLLAQAANFWISGDGAMKKLLLDPANTGMHITTDGLQLILDFWTGSRGISFRASGAEGASMFRDAAGQTTMLSFPGEFRLARTNPVSTGGNNWGSLNLYGGSNPAGWNQIRMAGYNTTLAQEPRWSLAHKIVLWHPNTGAAGDQDTVPGVGIGSSTTRMHFSVPNNAATSGFTFFAGFSAIPFWIGANGEIIAGLNTGNGARLQVQDGVFSLAVATSDFAVINGGMFFRSDRQTIRAGINGFWKDLAVQDTAYITGRVILVDQDNPLATDSRTGVYKYSQSVPFRTIQAAITAAVNGDIVRVAYSTTSYNGNIILDPNAWSSWLAVHIQLDNVTINGNLQVTQINNSSTVIYGINGKSTINGLISGLNAFPLDYIANLNIRDGIYGLTSPTSIISNCSITFINQLNRFLNGKITDSSLTFNQNATDYYDNPGHFNNCELTFAGNVFSYTQQGGDVIFENCRLNIGAALLSADQRAGGMRILLRNCRITFGPYLVISASSNAYTLALHNCQLISTQPGTAVVILAQGGVPAHTELIGTVRNCPIGVAATIAANDVQVASITSF